MKERKKNGGEREKKKSQKMRLRKKIQLTHGIVMGKKEEIRRKLYKQKRKNKKKIR